MSKSKIAVTIDAQVLRRLDALVSASVFASRSQGVEVAIREKLDRVFRTRLAVECAKLDPVRERALAEEGLGRDADEWPEY